MTSYEQIIHTHTQKALDFLKVNLIISSHVCWRIIIMKSQLKGGWIGEWNEIFNDLPAVVINEMQIWPHMWPSGRKRTKPGVNGPRKEERFSVEKRWCVLPVSDAPSFRVFFFSWSQTHWWGQEASWWLFQMRGASMQETKRAGRWGPWKRFGGWTGASVTDGPLAILLKAGSSFSWQR